MFKKQEELKERILKAVESEGVDTFKVIWGKQSGKTTLLKSILEYVSVVVFTTDKSPYDSNNLKLIDYTMAQSDIELTLDKIIEFQSKPDLIILEDFDYSGLNLGESTRLYNLLKERCEDYDIPALLILTNFNKPSATEQLSLDGICDGYFERLPTWEVNDFVSEEDIAPYLEKSNPRLLRDFACQ